MMRKAVQWSIAILGAGLITIASAAADEATYRRQVLVQLRSIAEAAASIDYESVGHRIAIMKRNSRMSLDVTLRKGSEYLLTSVCDSDCDGIGMSLYDQNGNLVDHANGRDQLAVSVTPRWTGPFRVVVHMSSCHELECHAGVAAFKR